MPAVPLLEGALPRIDFEDAYRLLLPPGTKGSMWELARQVFGSAAPWMKELLRVRDALVRPLGLKTASDLERRSAADRVGGRLGPGRVLAEGPDSLLLGADDRHLDFRVLLLRTASAQGQSLTLATVVRFNHWLGRAYFWVVGPVHRVLVPALLRRAARRMAATAASA